MSYGTRVMNAAILQIHKDLEEAAKLRRAAMAHVLAHLLSSVAAGLCWCLDLDHAACGPVGGRALLLYEGKENQVLAILIWNMWDEGYIEAVGAIGTLMMFSCCLSRSAFE